MNAGQKPMANADHVLNLPAGWCLEEFAKPERVHALGLVAGTEGGVWARVSDGARTVDMRLEGRGRELRATAMVECTQCASSGAQRRILTDSAAFAPGGGIPRMLTASAGRDLDGPWTLLGFRRYGVPGLPDWATPPTHGWALRAVIANTDNGLEAEIGYARDREGRLRVTGLTVRRDGGEEPFMTSGMAKSLPIDELTSLVSEMTFDMPRTRERASSGDGERNPRKLPDGFLARIARRYLELHAEGDGDSTSKLAAEEGVPRPTAAGWLARARRAGMLQPLPRGGARTPKGGTR